MKYKNSQREENKDVHTREKLDKIPMSLTLKRFKFTKGSNL